MSEPTAPTPAVPPASLSLELGAAGPCPVIEWRGKAYQLGHPTQAAKARYCEAIVDAELRKFRALRDRGIWTAAQCAEREEKLGGQLDRQEHAEGQPLWLKYAIGEEAAAGALLFAWALFAEHHPELKPADVRAMIDEVPGAVRLAIKRVVPDFFGWAGEALRLPPQQRQVLADTVSRELARIFPVPPTDSSSGPPADSATSPAPPTGSGPGTSPG